MSVDQEPTLGVEQAWLYGEDAQRRLQWRKGKFCPSEGVGDSTPRRRVVGFDRLGQPDRVDAARLGQRAGGA